MDTFSVSAHIRASKSPKSGNRILFLEEFSAEVVGRIDDLFQLVFDQPVLKVLEKIGHMPLPPYIDREDTDADKSRYQTVYADQLERLLLQQRGFILIMICFLPSLRRVQVLALLLFM